MKTQKQFEELVKRIADAVTESDAKPWVIIAALDAAKQMIQYDLFQNVERDTAEGVWS